MNHTPTPWTTEPIYTGNKIVAHRLYSGASFATIENANAAGARLSNETARANAAHIVTCVNSHDELLAALNKCVAALEFDAIRLQDTVTTASTIAEAKTAIARATEG